jgi:hypothetical protein
MRLGRFMSAEPVGTAPRETYIIRSSSGDALGVVEWYPRWGQYIFDPESGVALSHECLSALAAFCKQPMGEP